MKCPLLFPEAFKETGGNVIIPKDRFKENCVWWESKIGKCVITRMWIALQDIHEVLHDIKKELGGRR